VAFISLRKNVFVFAGLALVALLFYYPIINNNFLSDDYDSLYRISIERRILFQEFLRPLIDVSFYINYLISGLNPTSYYIFNLLIHVINAFLLYRFALSLGLFEDKRRDLFAIATALLFLVYPFHNESVAWLTGRLSSMAAFFALLVLNIWVSSLRPNLRLVLAAVLYLIGLLAYESILFLPLILAVLDAKGRFFFTTENLKRFFVAGVFILTAILLRFLISGAVYGNYGERMVLAKLTVYFSRSMKAFGRSILPPSENTSLMQLGFCLLLIVMVVLHFYVSKKYRSIRALFHMYQKIEVSFLIAMAIPMVFGISTRTSEGDRLLYFPSLFLCMLLAFVGLSVINLNKFRSVYFLLLFSFFSYFLYVNNRQWERASAAVSTVFNVINDSKGKKLYLVNVPDELEGAYVFRNGFKRSLVLMGYDTSKVIAVNFLTRLEYLKFPEAITTKKEQNSILVPPSTEIEHKAVDLWKVQNTNLNESFVLSENEALVYYWNQRRFVRLF
jgi:protein O-mannosyl-transferase